MFCSGSCFGPRGFHVLPVSPLASRRLCGAQARSRTSSRPKHGAKFLRRRGGAEARKKQRKFLFGLKSRPNKNLRSFLRTPVHRFLRTVQQKFAQFFAKFFAHTRCVRRNHQTCRPDLKFCASHNTEHTSHNPQQTPHQKQTILKNIEQKYLQNQQPLKLLIKITYC